MLTANVSSHSSPSCPFSGDFGPGEIAGLQAHAGIREIGSARAGEGVGIVDVTGAERELEAAGWSH